MFRRPVGAAADGHGHLEARDVVVTSRGRGAAARPLTATLQLPGRQLEPIPVGVEVAQGKVHCPMAPGWAAKRSGTG
jgi:hypothetical protein